MVPGCHGVESEYVGSFEKSIELQMSIALDTWIRRHASCMIVHVRIDDGPLEVVGEIEDQMIDSELLSDATRVVDIAHAATSRVALATPETKGDSDDVVSVLFQQSGGN